MSDGTTRPDPRPSRPERTAPTADAAAPAGPADPPRGRVRTGGRSERVRQAVAQAVLDLLAERVVDFGPSEVAARAGLNRKTIYRWWPTFADLVREGLDAHSSTVEVPDTGSWERDLRELAHRLALFFASPVEVSTNAIIAARGTPELSALIFEHFEPIQESWRAVVARGIARGEVHPGCTPERVLNILASPLILTPLTRHRPAAREEVDALVDFALRATRP
ncbi:TetR-like C-terminal domain-containing protein [Actinomadura sp. K4S16]|uniref:TetR-like C-terminal domain-containing protein n=1 Tax=Actinomadura sp. K4S16 TaxID=1316147 RepID=UPI0011ED56CD|nr:TetR-like C-terminal domain-containing protein [Actinomadura sp. K4S16]